MTGLALAFAVLRWCGFTFTVSHGDALADVAVLSETALTL